MKKIMEIKKNMTTDGHPKDPSVSHNRMKENANAVGKRRMRDEEYDREMVEIEVHLDLLMKLLQGSEEDQSYG
jgi:hypothetical protein